MASRGRVGHTRSEKSTLWPQERVAGVAQVKLSSHGGAFVCPESLAQLWGSGFTLGPGQGGDGEAPPRNTGSTKASEGPAQGTPQAHLNRTPHLGVVPLRARLSCLTLHPP